MADARIPTKEELQSYMRERRNWGRWGDRGGAVNLITADKRLAAAQLVRNGRAVSLSRPWPVKPTAENPFPAEHHVLWTGGPSGGGSFDYYGIRYHGHSATHVDALCHVWDQDGLWQGRSASEVLRPDGASHGSVDEWSDGILTRGVLLDVPKHRGKPYVALGEPVHGLELEAIAKAEGLTLAPGDAVMVYSGREAYAKEHGGTWGGRPEMPGLHPSCLPFVRDNDISVLGWDMLDVAPNDYGFNVHNAIPAFGVVLLDNALLEPLSDACDQEERYEFMLTINPLVVIGGTGSPVNPIAVF